MNRWITREPSSDWKACRWNHINKPFREQKVIDVITMFHGRDKTTELFSVCFLKCSCSLFTDGPPQKIISAVNRKPFFTIAINEQKFSINFNLKSFVWRKNEIRMNSQESWALFWLFVDKFPSFPQFSYECNHLFFFLHTLRPFSIFSLLSLAEMVHGDVFGTA